MDDLLWESVCAVGDAFTAGQIDEAEALARLDELGCTQAGSEGHLDCWKSA